MYKSLCDLDGKKGLVVGIANQHSIAYGCARAFKAWGADLAITYGNAKALPYVEPLAKELEASIFMPCDVTLDHEIDAVFQRIADTWGRLDFVLHAVAFAPKDALHAPVVNCPLNGFLTAMHISCYSFIHLARKAAPLMPNGGSLLTLSYYGSEKVVEHYNIMGVVKAALEATTRYLANDLGAQGIRVNTLSPGPIMTRAGSGIDHFEELLVKAAEKSPLRTLTTLADVGAMAAFLVSDAAKNITAGLHYIDGGYQSID